MTTRQLALPDIPVGTPQRRTRHTWGLPTGTYCEAECKSCTVHRRYGPFGDRQGYRWQWKASGGEWQSTEIPCSLKQ